MDGKKKKEGQKALLPEWVPNCFMDFVKDVPYRNYKHGLKEIMAAELRALVLSIGQAIVESIKKHDIEPDRKLKTSLENLVKYWPDPIAHEKEILKIKKEMVGIFNITIFTNRR
jgi:hypothetical protein